ncbi:hypothetical protein [Spirosoma aerolatum]|uniref:hypothetical protein n=1 Tax=Spirosoma aerolatum TaxID=1211326 RepID=UPI0009AD5087|nr:hypothetical protein [Spirosoma aerolatum]
MARKLSPAFRKQTARLVKAVEHAKKIRSESGHTTKTVKVYNLGWKSALKQSFKYVDRNSKKKR